MKTVLQTIAAMSVLAVGATSAHAEAYIGGSLGSSAMEPSVAENSIDQWNALVYGPGNDCDILACYSEEETSTALKIFGGYRVNPHFAVEGFIANFGDFDSYAEDGFGVVASATADVSTVGVAAVGMIPVGDGSISLLGKLGLHSWSADGDVALWDFVAANGYVASYSESGTDLMGGIGMQVDFGINVGMRVELEYFAANTDFSDFGIGLFSVGAMFRF